MLKSLVVYQKFTKLNKKQYSKCWQMALSHISSVQFSPSVCLTLFNPMDCSTPGFPVHQHFRSLLKCVSIKSMMPPNHLVLHCPLLLLPSIFPSIRVFSSESVLPIRWPKYWNFSFSINPSNECSQLISFRIDWFDFLAVQESSPTTQFKSINFGTQLSL